MADPNVLVTIPEVAAALGINKDHAYRLRKRGTLGLETIQVGGRVYCYRADLDRVLRGKPEPAPLRALPVDPDRSEGHGHFTAALAHLDGQIAVLQVQREVIAREAEREAAGMERSA